MFTNKRSLHFIRGLMAVIMMVTVALQSAPDTSAAATLLSRVTAPSSVTGGREITIRVTLSQVAPAGGMLVLMSSSSSLVPVPRTVVIPGGVTSHAIKVKTGTTANSTSVVLRASSGSVTKSATIIVKEPILSSLSVQSVYRAGGSGKVTVRLSGAAPSGGITVNLNSSRPSILPLPATVKVPAGYQNLTITVDPAMVSTEVTVNVSASYDGRKITRATIVRNLS